VRSANRIHGDQLAFEQLDTLILERAERRQLVVFDAAKWARDFSSSVCSLERSRSLGRGRVLGYATNSAPKSCLACSREGKPARSQSVGSTG